MGRKIPGRKHHGVRDPEKQRLEREKSFKNKINAPPTNPDDQTIPKSLQRLADIKNKIKTGEFFRKKPKKAKVVEQFQQYPGESDKAFLLRVNRACDVVKHEAAFEQKFGVEVKRNDQGEIESVAKRPRDPLEIMMKEVKREKKAKKKKKKLGENPEPRLTKSQKRQLKLKEKKLKKASQNVDGFKKFQDKVKFGEQAHAPPTLTAPRKVKKDNTAPRPGAKDLLLKSMLSLKKTSNKVIDKTGKRKELPNALRRQLDKQQEEVIQAYRRLKVQKLANK